MSVEVDDAARARLGLSPMRRRRSRRWSPRGWGLALLALAAGALLFWQGSGGAGGGPPFEATLPSVDAPPSAPAVPPAGLPPELLARLPVSKAVLGFATTAPRPEDSDEEPGPALDPAAPPRFVEWVEAPAGFDGPLRVEYALDAALTERVFKRLRRARVRRGHVVVMDIRSGRVMAYASADPEALPPRGAYPAASLAKVVTAAASLDHNRERAVEPCRYRGDPYRLTRARVNPARGGHVATLTKALARSYNQCFAQLAVHALGLEETRRAFARFGWEDTPGVGHAEGQIDPGEGDYGLGKLGSGLAGSRITALHAAQLVGSLATGELVAPWWIDRVVDAEGHVLPLPERGVRRRVMTVETAEEMRRMLVKTTTAGTARGAFRTRRGPRLRELQVAGKTGNLTGSDPHARYEWFAGVAPASDPRVAVAVVQAHGHLWWKMSAEIAAEVFSDLFCEGNRCEAEVASQFTGDLNLEPTLLGPGL